MYWLGFMSIFVFSFSLSFLLFCFPLGSLQDSAGSRSLHTGVTPRSGGIAIFISLIIGWILFSDFFLGLVSIEALLALVLLVFISLWDDFSSLHQGIRLFVQLTVAGVIVFSGELFFYADGFIPLILFKILSVLAFVWLINLYNFMDGMDGFASGMALIGFGSLACLGFMQGDQLYATFNLLIVSSVAGFWVWNFPPARIFMGDSGATVLGCLVGVSALLGVERSVFSLWAPIILFSPFWVDATYTLCKRIWRKEKFWQAHRSHFYQRLVLNGTEQQGSSHRQVLVWEYGLMLACSLSVIAAMLCGRDGFVYNTYLSVLALVWTGVYSTLIVLLERKLARA